MPLFVPAPETFRQRLSRLSVQHRGQPFRLGLTVLELIVTMSIIGLLAALLLPALLLPALLLLALGMARESARRTMAQVPSTWLGVALAGEDAAGRLVGATLEGINNPLADEFDFSSRHPGGANFLFGDGHVRFISESIDLWEYHRLARLRQL